MNNPRFVIHVLYNLNKLEFSCIIFCRGLFFFLVFVDTRPLSCPHRRHNLIGNVSSIRGRGDNLKYPE